MIVASDTKSHIGELNEVVRFERNHVGDPPAIHVRSIRALPIDQNEVAVTTGQVRMMTGDRLGRQLQATTSFTTNGKRNWVDYGQRVRNLISNRSKNPNGFCFAGHASTGSRRDRLVSQGIVANHGRSHLEIDQIGHDG